MAENLPKRMKWFPNAIAATPVRFSGPPPLLDDLCAHLRRHIGACLADGVQLLFRDLLLLESADRTAVFQDFQRFFLRHHDPGFCCPAKKVRALVS